MSSWGRIHYSDLAKKKSIRTNNATTVQPTIQTANDLTEQHTIQTLIPSMDTNNLYETDPSYFTFKKPDNWNSLPLYKKIFYYKSTLNKYYAPYVDKLFVKQIIRDLCGDNVKVAKVIRILNGPDDLHPQDLNADHIIKSTHGSGWNINIKKYTNLIECKQLLRSWNKSYSDLHNENQYKYIIPHFFIEEKVDDKRYGKNGDAVVYMIRCIHGEPITVGLKLQKYDSRRIHYTANWEPLDETIASFSRPPELDRMLENAKILSKPFEFVRVDFYIAANSDIYFSEFTFTPNGGYQTYSESTEKELGIFWK